MTQDLIVIIYAHIPFYNTHRFFVYPYQSLILPKMFGKINPPKLEDFGYKSFSRFILGAFLVTDPMSILGILVTRNARHGDQAHVYLIYSMW